MRRGAVIGPHIIGGVHRHLPLLRRWQPRLITVLEPNRDEMRALRHICPNSVIVGRVYVDDGQMAERIEANPEAAAEWAHALTVERALCPEVDFWQVANEVHQGWGALPLLVRFESKRMQLAEAAGYRCAIFAFSVGNPDLPEHDRLAAWRRVSQALYRANRYGHVVAIHQYGKPDLWGPDSNWYIHRLEHNVLKWAHDEFPGLRFVVTEYGIDGLINSPDGVARGWQHYTDAAGYVEQLTNIGQYVEKFGAQVIGYSVFTLGHSARWESYDIVGEVAEGLTRFYESRPSAGSGGDVRPVEPPPVEEPGEEVTGSEQTEQSEGVSGDMGEVNQARAYGVRVLPGTVKPGEEYWRVVEVRHLTPSENRGRHNIYVDAVDGEGKRVRDGALRIGWTWEGRRADEPAPPKPLDKPDNEPAGNVDLNKGQVVRIWIADEGRPSDAVEGMHTGHADELGPGGEKWNSIGHHSFYVRFQLAKANGVPTTGDGSSDKPTEPDGGELPAGNGDLVAMVQALQIEVAGLRRWQNKVTAFLAQLTGEL